jgi:DNA-binding response OmpR family regulator
MKQEKAHPADHLTILVVENHPDTLKWLALYLEDCGHEVRGANTLREGRDILGQMDIDFILSDLGLADGTGLDLLKSRKAAKPLFCVAMSGFGMESDTQASSEAGFDAYLQKPFNMAKLDALLAEALLLKKKKRT